VPNPPTGAAPDLDRHFRRLAWLVYFIILTAAAFAYAGKASDERSAFIRWRPQVLQFWEGVNIYQNGMMFPNPPVMPITLYPFMTLPPVPGAMCWFVLKAALAIVSILLCLGMVRTDGCPLPSWFQAGVLFFSLRPILGDLHHGNNNLVILFLVVTALQAWRKGYDVLAGLLLALSISYKVTPALFVPYFLYKRSWRTVIAAGLGLAIFLVIVPSLVVGPQFNWECLSSWWQHMMSPFLNKGEGSPQEPNQSMVGVLTRLLTDTPTGTDRYDVHLDLNLFAWPHEVVSKVIRGVSLTFVALLAFFCRTRTDRRTDPRLLGEFALVVLTMLFLSERSWKHHYVTQLLPFTYLMYCFASPASPFRTRVILAAAIWGAAIMQAATSSELGGLLAHGQGHKIAQGYGLFLWSGVVLYAATAWRVYAQRRSLPRTPAPPERREASAGPPAPHFPGRTRPETVKG
jgi:hypothetical protein